MKRDLEMDSRAKKYTGPLRTKIKLPRLPNEPTILADKNKTKEKYEAILKARNNILLGELDKKIPLVFEHHEISTNDSNKWEKLALKLAKAHIPGFQIQHTVGRKIKWSDQLYVILYRDVNKVKEENKFNIEEACEYLLEGVMPCVLPPYISTSL